MQLYVSLEARDISGEMRRFHSSWATISKWPRASFILDFRTAHGLLEIEICSIVIFVDARDSLFDVHWVYSF